MDHSQTVGKQARGAAVDAVADRVRAPKGVRKNARLITGHVARLAALDSGPRPGDKAE
jgi:hypothetical protein